MGMFGRKGSVEVVTIAKGDEFGRILMKGFRRLDCVLGRFPL